MGENSYRTYVQEEWYKQLSSKHKEAFDTWYDSERKKERSELIEIASVKEEIFETSYGLKGTNYIHHPSRIKQMISKARKIIPSELLTEKLNLRLKELERKVANPQE